MKHVLDLVENILEEDEDIVVPVKKVWVKLKQDYYLDDLPSLEQFTSLLRDDDRFEFLPLKEPEPPYRMGADDLAREEKELEELGFYRGPRVKLRRIELTEQLLVSLIKRKMQEMLDALKSAWDTKSPDDGVIEDQLIRIRDKAERHLEEIENKLGQEESPRQEAESS